MKAKAFHTPSLFCFSVVLPSGTEVELIRQQFLRGKVGIYACEDWSVYSNTSIRLGADVNMEAEAWTSVLPGDLKVDHYTFYRLWNKILGEGRALAHDWTVKSDADAVFFPSRLRGLLRDKWAPSGKTDDTVILRHCYSRVVPLYPDANRGPILVLSQQALLSYMAKQQVAGCPHGTSPGEFHETQCLRGIGAATTAVDAFGLLSEVAWACDTRQQSGRNADSSVDAGGEAMYGCFAPAVAFHPFKSVEKWFHCRGQAESGQLGQNGSTGSEAGS